MIHCPICNGSLVVAFEAQVLCRHKATYDYCHGCGFLRARNPQWLAEVGYAESPDAGLWARFYWSDKYCDNLLARGFEYMPEFGPCCAVTAIEIMEHLEDPLGFVSEALERTKAKVFIFTTELFEGTPPTPSNWWYYSFETGQHIAFFQRRTLEFMAKKFGLFFVSEHGIHIFSKEPIESWRLRLVLGRFGNLLTRNSRRMLVG